MTKTLSWKLVLVLAIFPVSSFAQSPFSTGSGPVVSASLGYSYVSLPMPSSTRLSLNGAGASITADFRSRFGIKIDLNYARAANVYGTGHHSDVLSYMAGPVFYPVNNDRLTVYIQGLAGGSRITGVVPNGAGGFYRAYTSGLSWAVGGGIQRSISSSLAVQTETDYLHTSYIDSSVTFRSQNGLRIVGSLVYRWGTHSNRRHDRGRF
jgi:hypothetical protein